MKINHKVLSLPPYVSTSWKNVSMLSMEKETLVIVLNNGSRIAVPGLEEAVVREIFSAHERFMDTDADAVQTQTKERDEKPKVTESLGKLFSLGIPLELNEGTLGLENEINSFLHHNPELSSSPDFPREMLERVADVAKKLGLDANTSHLPKPEPHCNCPYCQIARALSDSPDADAEAIELPEEEVSDEELTFREWDIEDLGQSRYKVANPLNENESFQVYLGKPIGCTCGTKNCEHIKAVLNS